MTVWMILRKEFCPDDYYGPYVGVSWVGNKPPPRELLDEHNAVYNWQPLPHVALSCGEGNVDVHIENHTFVGDGLVPEHIPCDYVAPYARTSGSAAPIKCCAGKILTADEEETVACPKCQRRGSIPNPHWPYPKGE